MLGKVFLFVGVVLIVVGVLISRSDGRVTVNRQTVSAEEGGEIKNYIGLGVGGLGAIFAVVGLVGMVRGSAQRTRNLQITQSGIPAEGTVIFVDKNFAILVNQKPVYSILEYTYQDSSGRQHTRRITNLNSDIVIRNQIQVGGKVSIKYAADNPAESVILLKS